MNDYKDLFKDKALEEAMIKTCLLFDSTGQANRESVFQKTLLALLFDRRYNTVEEAYQLLSKEPSYEAIDKGKIETTIKRLEKECFVLIKKDGSISLTVDAVNKSVEYAKRQNEQFAQMVEDVFRDVKRNTNSIQNEAQVRQNIKECIEYYIRVSTYKFMGVDEAKRTNELPELEKKAGFQLNSNDGLKDQILLSIGNLIDQPTSEQSSTLEVMARCLITMRIMGMDYMLSNFKQSILRKKVFILDTDFLLYLITDCGNQSKCYKALMEQLCACGCKMYIPKEIISEVYDHAEAATKRYCFVNPILVSNPGSWADYNISNVFLEAFYEQRSKDVNCSWPKFIENYLDKKVGERFTEDVVREKLSKYRNIELCRMPENCQIFDDNNQDMMVLREQLYEKALRVTLQTEKAENRDDSKNEKIAKTDTMLYLSVKYLNDKDRERNGSSDSRKDLLHHRYYVITNTFRIYPCAQELGLDERSFCKPASLMAYLLETGFMSRGQVQITSLFDNPFLLFIAEQSWDDAEKLAKAGIDFSNVSIVRLRYDLQNQIEKLLTSVPGTIEYSNVVDEVKEKGYSFVKQIEYAKQLEDLVNKKDECIARLTLELERQKTIRGKERYKNLAEQFNKRSKKK